MPTGVLTKEYMTFLVYVHIRDVVTRVVAVHALVQLVISAVPIARFDSMVSPVLVAMVPIVADDFTTVQAYA